MPNDSLLRQRLRAYLAQPSSDGRPIRIEMRKELAALLETPAEPNVIEVSFAKAPGTAAKVSVNQPGEYDDIVIEFSRNGAKAADIVVGTDPDGKLAIRSTLNAMRESEDHLISVHPEERADSVDSPGVVRS